jgi:hypothetical protein
MENMITTKLFAKRFAKKCGNRAGAKLLAVGFLPWICHSFRRRAQGIRRDARKS